MKKIIFISLIAMSGCATVPSEYNQGCRDGVSQLLRGAFNTDVEPGTVADGCDELERSRDEHKNNRDPGSRR